jgi:AraC-like DNA-binding protein
MFQRDTGQKDRRLGQGAELAARALFIASELLREGRAPASVIVSNVIHAICDAMAPAPLLNYAQRPSAAVIPGGLAPWKVRKVSIFIEGNLCRAMSVGELAAQVGLSSSHFSRAFKSSFGTGPHTYLVTRRIRRAQLLMMTTTGSLADIAMECGMSDQSHLCRQFRTVVGESPAFWRRKALRFEHGARQTEPDFGPLAGKTFDPELATHPGGTLAHAGNAPMSSVS